MLPGHRRGADDARLPHHTVDVKSMAMSSFVVTFHGKKAHAALKPEDGRSALDGLLMAFNGIEFLREHVPDGYPGCTTLSSRPQARPTWCPTQR